MTSLFLIFRMSKSYCNELENIATTLKNLGTTISDNLLALQVLQGLTSKYKTFRSLVQHLTPTPTFESLQSMLELEEHSNNKDEILFSRFGSHYSFSSTKFKNFGKFEASVLL